MSKLIAYWFMWLSLQPKWNLWVECFSQDICFIISYWLFPFRFYLKMLLRSLCWINKFNIIICFVLLLKLHISQRSYPLSRFKTFFFTQFELAFAFLHFCGACSCCTVAHVYKLHARDLWLDSLSLIPSAYIAKNTCSGSSNCKQLHQKIL